MIYNISVAADANLKLRQHIKHHPYITVIKETLVAVLDLVNHMTVSKVSKSSCKSIVIIVIGSEDPLLLHYDLLNNLHIDVTNLVMAIYVYVLGDCITVVDSIV